MSDWLGSTANLFAVETEYFVVNGSFEDKLILFTCFMLSISFFIVFLYVCIHCTPFLDLDVMLCVIFGCIFVGDKYSR